MFEPPFISIIIVNYNAASFLRKCIDSIETSEISSCYEIIVVDNNSSQRQQYLKLKKCYPNVTFLDLKDNRGFAAGNNAGMAVARGNCFLLLNPDTIVDKNAIQRLYDRLIRNPENGIAGPKIFNSDGSLQSKQLPKTIPNLKRLFFNLFYLDKIMPFNKWFDKYYLYNADYDKEQYFEQISGSCLMIKADIVKEIGMMDEKYFLYFEETDWCQRALEKGYKTLFVAGAEIIHYEGGSISNKVNIKAYYQSQLYFFKKHYGRGTAILMFFLNLLGFTLRFLVSPLYFFKRSSRRTLLINLQSMSFHLNPQNLLHLLQQ